MPRRPPRSASLLVGLVLAGCGGKLQSGVAGTIPEDAAARTGDDGADAAPIVSSQGDDAAAPSSPLPDAAAVVLLPSDDASLPGTPSPGGGTDPNGPCPAATQGWRCLVEGAHLCGAGCSMQCTCADGFWLCHLPPC